MELAVIIPVFNEEKTIRQILTRVLAQKVVEQVIVVDDASRDGTTAILKNLNHPRLKVTHHQKNSGKGVAIRTGLKSANAPFVICQDADLEYNPNEYKKLLKYAKNGRVVYGSRIKGNNPKAYIRTYIGNVLLTELGNFLFGTKLTDSYTCYKLMPTKLARSLKLTSRGFEVEAEITGKLAKRKIPILEVPISYKPRSYEEGKKIKTKDALKGALTFLKIRFCD